MKKTLKILSLLLMSIIFLSSTPKDKEKFYGEKRIEDCRIDIPLHYSTKGQEALKEAAEKYKEVEIVLVTKGKKGKASFAYYYIVPWESSYGPSAYLERSEQHNSQSTRKEELFINYKPKRHSFYKADCFRSRLKSEPDLLNYLIEEK